MVRRGPGRIGAEAVVPARGAHRLHLLGDRRGTRLRRRVPGDRAVRAAGRARVLDRLPLRRHAPPFRRLLRVRDRKSVVSGKSVSVRVDLGGRRIIKKKHNLPYSTNQPMKLSTYTITAESRKNV